MGLTYSSPYPRQYGYPPRPYPSFTLFGLPFYSSPSYYQPPVVQDEVIVEQPVEEVIINNRNRNSPQIAPPSPNMPVEAPPSPNTSYQNTSSYQGGAKRKSRKSRKSHKKTRKHRK